jgi:5-(carboxyamino)imidazole ribonucleotide synthase
MFKRQLKVGIIKGGQLGKMLLQEAASFDIHALVMDNDPHCPCRPLADFTLGDCDNFEDVYSFGKKVDVLTFEYEHINIEALKRLKSEGVVIYPDPSVIEIVQNKATQKDFYRQHGIPTADFKLISNRMALRMHEDFFPAIQKTCKAGYDGKGIYKIANKDDMASAFDEPSILEQWVDFKKEISVLVARNAHGQCAIYPTVEMEFHPEKNLVEFLLCPANIPKEIDAKAKDIAMTIAQKLNLVGTLAVEMFIDQKDQVLVNEIAPRVHNSGHHTIEGSLTSQFEQHMRAVLGLPLGLTNLTLPSVMVNILGADGYDGPAAYEGIEEALALEGVFIHLYGKAITKPFRKMGHATILDKDINAALIKARQVKDLIKVRT